MHHDERPANGFVCGSFFCVVCGWKGSSGGAEPHPYNGPRGACVIINAISVFRSRGRVWFRPHLPRLQTPKYCPVPLAGLRCRPLRAKDSGPRKNPCISVFRRMVEHGSPAKALCCRKAPRVEQSPTPTMDRERMRMKFGAFRGFTVGAGLLIFLITTVRAAAPHQEKLS